MENGSVVEGSIMKVENSVEANVGDLMRRATDVAGVCREIVMKTAQTIQGRKYVRVEGWQSIAVAYGLVASSRDVSSVFGPDGRLEGVRAVGEVRRMSDGVVVSTAEGYVGIDEPTWFGGEQSGRKLPPRPMYAIRAMAQTRSVSRACRGALSFVVTLIDSGLSTTPAEEMDGINTGSVEPPAPRGTAALRQTLSGPPPPPSPPLPTATPSHDSTQPTQPTHDRSLSFRFGNAKGTPLAQLAEGDLKFYEGALKRDLASDDPTKQRYVQSNTLALTAVQAEQRFRGI